MDDFLSRSIAFLQRSTAVDPADPVQVREFGNGFAVAYVVEDATAPDGMVWVRQHHLTDAGASPAELHKVAMDNLFNHCTKHIRVQQFGAVFGLFIDGKFEASMFLLERLWQKDLADLVGNGYAIAAPSRDVLAFCDIDSAEGKAELKRMIDRVKTSGDHLISPELFRIRKKPT